MNQLPEYLLKLGGLHDARLVAMNWHVESQVVEFVVDDIYANFLGLPEYPGRQSGVIRLEGVSHVEFAVEASQELKLFELLPAEDHADEVVAKFSPGGRVRIRYAAAIYPSSLI
ncbi:hypothetical protein GHT07_02115 [Caenimonas koreensis DSM 17982]|uniref:Uncharacterized protein n=1 Tax=Caenimonas koreensis DSM 17982 TaxID=1121255 RepID=A0A844AUK4_9BURK|nr:hypothetical protein [Caenimonas koreensis]MRD46058.1 hypothetical protein [Caenimonas koreensis DSM 17982]